MSKNIEVEIRGNLDTVEYDRVKVFLDEHGEHVESQEREMFLLKDYPGFGDDFVGRQTDIRLRNTNGNCEIMLKIKVGTAREEVSLQLKDSDLESAKKVVKALGCTSALWMHRQKEVYRYHDIEWSLVICPQDIRYFEAERVVADADHIAEAQQILEDEVRALGLVVLDDDGTRALIHKLDTEVNKVVAL